ncbi:MAG: tetratricopeptide repeat protein [Armatimonadota bacterium]
MSNFCRPSGVYLLVTAGVFGPSPVWLKAWLAVLTAAAVVGLPVLHAVLMRAEEWALEREQESMYRAAAAARPDNAAAYAGLAQLLYRQGRLDEAIRNMEQAVRLSPHLMEAEARLLEEWVGERNSFERRPLACRQCGAEVPADSKVCPVCGWSLGGYVRGMLSASSKGLAAAAAGIGLSGLMPAPLNAMVVVAALGTGAYITWRGASR